ncbi:MAG: alpha/beta fold hydrolase [Acidimicrobiia bacterium]
MRVSIGDCRLYVDVEGPGLVPAGPTMRSRPTLILLHGGPGFDHSSFKPHWSHLADVAQVVYYDHRGQGRSDRSPPATWNLAQWAADLVALCDALEIESPIVYGVSFGGIVALQYLLDHPEHPAKVILDSTTTRSNAALMLPVFERLGGEEARAIAERFWSDPTPESLADYFRVCMPRYGRTTPPDADDRMRRQLEVANFELFDTWSRGEQRTFDLTPRLGEARRPVLLLAGEDDPVCPVAGAELIAAGLPDCRFERFADCGHGVWRDQPEAAFRHIRDFILD